MLDTDVTPTRGVFGRAAAWLRGDRYMVGAYAPRPQAIARADADDGPVVEQDTATRAR